MKMTNEQYDLAKNHHTMVAGFRGLDCWDCNVI